MNNQSVLGKVVNELTRPQGGNGGGGSKRSNRRGRRAASRSNGNGAAPAGGQRGLRARNPGSRPLRGQDNNLSLTRSQFTATSPLNLFEVRPASTPGGILVKGRELIGSATAPNAIAGTYTNLFVAGAYPLAINPVSFPRLSAYVPIYEWYVFRRLSLLFMSNQPTTTAGEVLMCIEYDYKDTAPGSAAGVMRNISSTMANIYSDASLQLVGSLSRLPKFSTSQTTAPDTDQVNQAALYVAVEGVTAATGAILGYVVAQYEIEFFTPQ